MVSIIPRLEMPKPVPMPERFSKEKLVSLKDMGFMIDPQYKDYPGGLSDCLARKSVAEMLIKAGKNLPAGLHFKIFDAYRPVTVQQALWDKYKREVLLKAAEAGEELSVEEADRRTSEFVSKPSYDKSRPSVHNTGGAVDLTLVRDCFDGTFVELDMGTAFDDFTEKAHTAFFEKKCNGIEDIIVHENRRILYQVMTEAGFTNLPSEWWHYDYGDAFWAYYKDAQPIYDGV